MAVKFMTLLHSKHLLVFALILTLLPVLIICLYIHPSADDFYYASWFKAPHAKSFLSYQAENYLSWNGRYFSTVLLSLNPLVFESFALYKMIPFIVFAVFYTGLFFFIKNVFSGISTLTMHIICLLLCIVYFNAVPSLPETLYWMPASVTYLLPWGFSFLLFGLLIKANFVGSKRKYIVSVIFLAVCIAGSNELSAIMLGIVGVLLVFLPIAFYKRRGAGSFVLLIIAVVCILFVVSAPGNAYRTALFENHHNLSYAIMSSLKNSLKIAVFYFKEPVLMMLLLLVLINSKKLFSQSAWLQKISKYPLPIMPVFLVGSVLFFYFVSAYSMGIEPPLRIHSFMGILIIMGTALFIIILNLKTGFLSPCGNTVKKLNTVLIILFFGFTFSGFHRKAGEDIYIRGNIVQCLYDLRYDAPLYNKEMNKRYELTKAAINSGNTVLVLPPLSSAPSSIFFVDMKTDSTHWINEGYAKYFGLKNVYISGTD